MKRTPQRRIPCFRDAAAGISLARLVATGYQASIPANIARQIARQVRSSERAMRTAAAMPTGTRLVRDWHKVSHHVLVTDTGYLYSDRHFASLSAIAREITGTVWSGPRFFRLLAKRRNAAHA